MNEQQEYICDYAKQMLKGIFYCTNPSGCNYKFEHNGETYCDISYPPKDANRFIPRKLSSLVKENKQ